MSTNIINDLHKASELKDRITSDSVIQLLQNQIADIYNYSLNGYVLIDGELKLNLSEVEQELVDRTNEMINQRREKIINEFNETNYGKYEY